MNHYREVLKNVEKECLENVELSAETEIGDEEYKSIRVKALKLLEKSHSDLNKNEYEQFKKLVLEFLCENCGCHLDYEVLKDYTPNVLSDAELEYIVENSALARWF